MNEVYQRLSKIFNRLCNGEELTIGGLAKDYGVSTKTIQRDLKERLSGKSLIREGNRFFLNLKKTPPKDFVFEILQNMAKEMGGEFRQEAHKILGMCQGNERLESPMQNLNEKIQEILSIQKAIAQKRVLKMKYYSEELAGIEPLALLCSGGMWYLCVQNKRGKEYLLLSEIEECRVGRKHFAPLSCQISKIEVSLFVYPEVAHEIKAFEFAENQSIVEDAEGNLIVDFVCEDLLGIEREVMKWIPYVAVLEPQVLKDRIEGKVLDYTQRCGIGQS